MRKGIIAAIVAVALFAVGAFAATFTVTSDEVTSGTDSFSQCATGVTVDFATGSYDGSGIAPTDDFPVTGATATFAGAGCDDKVATLAVLGSDGAAIAEVDGNAVVAGSTVGFTLTGVSVGEVFGSAVLVEGIPIP